MTKKIFRLIIGLILYSIGIVLTINADLGLAPWDALHVGLSTHTGLTFGVVSMFIGVSVLLINYQLGESIGIGTVANIFVIGVLIDLIFLLNLIPMANGIISGIIMLILGMITIAFASYFYIGSGFGTGPRDGIMVALVRVTGKPVAMIRGSIELSVLTLGYLLGAKIGIGTLIIAFGIGPIVQMVFKLFKFDVHKVQHKAFLKKEKLRFGR